jgi:hypothetical protein
LTLLVTLIVTLLVTPVLGREISGLPIMQLFFSAIFLVGVYALSRDHRVLIAVALVAGMALISTWLRHLVSEPLLWVSLADYATDIAFFGLIASAILRTILQETRVTADTIYGGISVYLLIGLLWAVFCSAVEFFAPGSYVLDGVSISELTSDARNTPIFRELIYFSFVTMTTLGYGDIRPMTDLSRAAATAEAVVGQLFVAVFIARLVGLHLVHASRDED